MHQRRHDRKTADVGVSIRPNVARDVDGSAPPVNSMMTLWLPTLFVTSIWPEPLPPPNLLDARTAADHVQAVEHGSHQRRGMISATP